MLTVNPVTSFSVVGVQARRRLSAPTLLVTLSPSGAFKVTTFLATLSSGLSRSVLLLLILRYRSTKDMDSGWLGRSLE